MLNYQTTLPNGVTASVTFEFRKNKKHKIKVKTRGPSKPEKVKDFDSASFKVNAAGRLQADADEALFISRLDELVKELSNELTQFEANNVT